MKSSCKGHLFALSVTSSFVFAAAIIELPKNDDVKSEITSLCLLNILNSYCNQSKKLTLRYDNDERQVSVVEQLLQLSAVPASMNVEEKHAGVKLDKRLPSDVVIILGDSLDLTTHLKKILFTSKTAFFVVFWDGPHEMRDIFRSFRKFNVLDAFLLKVDANGVHVYESDYNRNCNGEEPMLLDYRSGADIRRGEIPRLRTKYPIRRFNNCTFTVSTVDMPPTVIFPEGANRRGSSKIDGIEGRMYTTISEKINATFWYKTSNDGVKWGFIYPQPVGGVGEVYMGISEAASGSPSLTLERVSHLDYVLGTSSTTECIAWFVPTGLGRDRPVWLGIFLSEFTTEMWISLAVVLAAMVASFCIAYRTVGVGTAPGVVNVILLLLSSALGATVRVRKSWTVRALLASWFFYGLVISSAYESSLRSKLTIPLRNKDINSYSELIDTKLDLLGISTTIKVLYRAQGDPIREAIGRRAKPTNASIEDIVARMTRDRNIAYMREYTTFVYTAYNDARVMDQIHKIEECGLEYIPSVYLQKRSILEPALKDIIGHLAQSGILQFWRSLYIRESAPPQTNVFQLTVEHMTAPLIAYGVGVLLGVAAFLAERVRPNGSTTTKGSLS